MNRTTVGITAFLIVLITTLPLVAAASYSLTYDANGNLVSGDGKYRVYDSFNHLVKLYNGTDTSGTLLQEYIYHPTEDRIRLMMQSLLADRFQLATHYETRQPPPASPGSLPESLNVPAPLDVLVVDHVEQPSAN